MTYKPRTEYKYIISFEKSLILADLFETMLRPDKHNQAAGYPILSVYYDTADYDFFHEKIEGEFYHRKARLRTYGLSVFAGPSFFEIKYKYHDDGYKHRIAVDGCDSLMELAQSMQFDDPERRLLLGTKPILPVCCVFYRRKAYTFMGNHGEIRLNLDSEIAWRSEISSFTLSHLSSVPLRHQDHHDLLFYDGSVVLEIKADHRLHLGELEDIFAIARQRRMTFSKYISCLNLAHSSQLMETPYGF